mgnify:CR=1 FL=1
MTTHAQAARFQRRWRYAAPRVTIAAADAFLADHSWEDWDDLSRELRAAELAVRRYDTRKLKDILLRLVPELAKTPISTRPGAAADVVSLNRTVNR